MIKTIYKCDKCHKEWDPQKDTTQLCTVGIAVVFESRRSISTHDIKGTADWCRNCVMKTGIHPPVILSDKKIAPDKELSFEERFIELLADIGINQSE